MCVLCIIYCKTYLNRITSPGTTYSFTYDDFGNILSTKIGDTALSTNTYESGNGNLSKVTYGNSNEAVMVDKLIVAAGGGAVSGAVGGAGANKNMALTKTIQTTIKTSTKMKSRNNTTYAAKRIASTKAWRNNILSTTAVESSARFSAGIGISNAISGAWTSVKSWFSKWF